MTCEKYFCDLGFKLRFKFILRGGVGPAQQVKIRQVKMMLRDTAATELSVPWRSTLQVEFRWKRTPVPYLGDWGQSTNSKES